MRRRKSFDSVWPKSGQNFAPDDSHGLLRMREKQMQILRLTTPELKNVRGPFRS
jgi:hypothetical protein